MWTGVTPVRDTWSICWWYDCMMSLLRELLLSLWIWRKKENLTHSIFFSVINSEAASFYTQGLMSPYLRASVTNFRQSPMSWYEVTPVMKNKMEQKNGCHCLFVMLNQVNPSFFNRGIDSLFLIRTHSCSTKSKSPRSKKELKMGGSDSVFGFGVLKKRRRSKKSNNIYSDMNESVQSPSILTLSYLSCFFSLVL